MKITEGQMDFLGLLSEYTDDQGATVRVREPGRKQVKPVIKAPEPEQLSIDFSEPMVTKEPKPEMEEVPKPVIQDEFEPIIAKEPEPKKREKTQDIDSDMLFKQCKKCWCFDCKHNSRNEGVPREVCGMSMPCPPCDTCISEDCPTICEIGNAKEGCKLRALEEGITEEKEEGNF